MSSPDARDQYWQWEGDNNTSLLEVVQARGYQIPQLTPVWRLHKLNKRHGKLPCYDRCTDEELEMYIRDRRLLIRTTESKPKARPKPNQGRLDMIVTLYDADDHPKFSRFLQLPPEIRLYVHEYYVAGFAGVLSTPTQPPLARLCRTLREELLPVFYGSCTFSLTYLCPEGQRSMGDLYPTTSTSIFLLALQPVDVALIRKLKLSFKIMDRYRKKKNDEVKAYLHCLISLGDSGDASDVNVEKVNNSSHTLQRFPGGHRKAERSIRKALERVIQQMCSRRGTMRLQPTDILAMRLAVQDVLQMHTG